MPLILSPLAVVGAARPGMFLLLLSLIEGIQTEVNQDDSKSDTSG